jgi:hypothetical protein
VFHHFHLLQGPVKGLVLSVSVELVDEERDGRV